MPENPMAPMTVENADEFDVWIFKSADLVVSVVPHDAPWSATAENYRIGEAAD